MKGNYYHAYNLIGAFLSEALIEYLRWIDIQRSTAKQQSYDMYKRLSAIWNFNIYVNYTMLLR